MKLFLVLALINSITAVPVLQGALSRQPLRQNRGPNNVLLGPNTFPPSDEPLVSDRLINIATGLDQFVTSVGNMVIRLGGLCIEWTGFIPNEIPKLPTTVEVLIHRNVKRLLGLSHAMVVELPLQVLNIPSYGYWNGTDWSLRFRARVYRQPRYSFKTLDRLANVQLIGTDLSELQPSQVQQARELTAELYSVPEAGCILDFSLSSVSSPGQSVLSDASNGAVDLASGGHIVTFDRVTDAEGDIDGFLSLHVPGIYPLGKDADAFQRVSLRVPSIRSSYATSYLVPQHGLTIVSDIDDILRLTSVWSPPQALLNTIARPYVPWLNMPVIYKDWSDRYPNTHFHYLTTTPERITRTYMNFLEQYYPGGTFDPRPSNKGLVGGPVRRDLLQKVMETFPKREFVLVGDNSNWDVLDAYTSLARMYPSQVRCIFLRNITATDEGLWMPYSTRQFKEIDEGKYMFFEVPDDLRGLDIGAGECRNASVKQSVTYGLQNLQLLGFRLGPK